MLYVKTEDLKVGMRLARPIYSRNGTLLYSCAIQNLLHQGIISVRNFRIIGLSAHIQSLQSPFLQ